MANVKVNVSPRIDPLVKVNPACGRHREAPEPEAKQFHEELESATREAWKKVKKDAAKAPKREKPKKKEESRKTSVFSRKKGKR